MKGYDQLLIEQSKLKDENMSIFAIREMIHYPSPKIYERLLEIIEGCENRNKVETAIYSLLNLKPSKRFLSSLLPLIFHEEERLRAASALVLSKIRTESLLEVRKILDKKLSDLKNDFTSSFFWLIGKIGEKEDVDRLIKLRETIKPDDVLIDSINNAIQSIEQRDVRMWEKYNIRCEITKIENKN